MNLQKRREGKAKVKRKRIMRKRKSLSKMRNLPRRREGRVKVRRKRKKKKKMTKKSPAKKMKSQAMKKEEVEALVNPIPQNCRKMVSSLTATKTEIPVLKCFTILYFDHFKYFTAASPSEAL